MPAALQRPTTRLIAWLLAMALVLAGALVAPDAARATEGFGFVSGTVADEAGTPTEAVEVVAFRYEAEWDYWAWQGSAYTAEDGTYALADLPAGQYKLQFVTTATGTGLVSQWWIGAPDEWSATVLTLEPDATLTDISPVLLRGGSIRGVVTDAQGAGAANVEVVAFADGPWDVAASTMTDDTGAYELSGLAPGEYRIEFQTTWATANVLAEWWDDADSYETASGVAVTADGLVDGISPELASGNSVSGTVTDESGAPLQGVRVDVSSSDAAAGWHMAWTDENGAYTVRSVPDGEYLVGFNPDYTEVEVAREWWQDASVEWKATRLTLTGATETTGIDAELSFAGGISGTVTDESGSAVTDASVNAYVFDAENGSWSWVASTEVEGDGAFSLRGLHPEEYKLHVTTWSDRVLSEWWRDSRDEAAAEIVAVTAGATASGIDVRLDPAGRIAGVVTDSEGAPVSGVTVTAKPVDGSAPETMISTDESGAYDIGGLTSGAYKVRFTTENASSEVAGEWWDGVLGEDQASVVAVEEGATAGGIDASLDPATRIRGTVTDADGNPIPSVSVLIFEGNDLDPAAVGWTNDDGTYALRGLRAGTYRVQFSTWQDAGTLTEWWNNAPTREAADDLEVVLGQHRDDLDLTLDERDGSVMDRYDATLSGRVVDERGEPIPGVLVGIEDADRPAGDGVHVDEEGNWASFQLPGGRYRVSFTASFGDRTVKQWWEDAADKETSDVITLAPGEQRTGIDAVLRAPVPPRLESSTPVITGSPRVGSTLAVDPGAWTPGTEFAFQWLAGGAPIEGATSSVFTPTAAEFKKRLSVQVTGSLDGYSAVTETSELTAPIVRGKLSSTKPQLAGTPAVGETLVADAGSWTAGTTLRYRWLAGGLPILGADGDTLTITPALVGKRIRVTVTGTQRGYLPQLRVSVATAKVAPKVSTRDAG